jgi:hypothetical protein
MRDPAQRENVVVTVPNDQGLYLDIVEPAPGAVCTGSPDVSSPA